jgi:hypothetical protein
MCLTVELLASPLHFASVESFLDARFFFNIELCGIAAAGTATQALGHDNRLLCE